MPWKIATGARFGHRDCGDDLPAAEARQPALLLLLGGQTQQIRGDDVVVARTPLRCSGPGGLFGDDGVVAEVGVTAAAVLSGHGHPEKAPLSGLEPQAAVDDLVLFPLIVERRDVAIEERKWYDSRKSSCSASKACAEI